MKTLLLTAIAIALLAQAGRGQAPKNKSVNYYYYTCTFQSTDGCPHDQWGKFSSRITSANYADMYKAISDYVRPYKIIKGTFKINEYRQLPRKEWLTYKANKFTPCAPISVKLADSGFNFSGLTVTTSVASSRLMLHIDTITMRHLNYYIFLAKDLSETIFSVSGQDSTGKYTVRFAKSKVHFLNDSTFTFKTK